MKKFIVCAAAAAMLLTINGISSAGDCACECAPKTSCLKMPEFKLPKLCMPSLPKFSLCKPKCDACAPTCAAPAPTCAAPAPTCAPATCAAPAAHYAPPATAPALTPSAADVPKADAPKK